MKGDLRIIVGVSLLVVAGSALPACSGGRTERAYAATTEESARAGREVIEREDCGSCHTIPGIRGARGLVGPPLTSFGRRTYIAGELPNTADNLTQWVMNPHSVEPGTAMPDLGLEEDEARAVVAYLYTLR